MTWIVKATGGYEYCCHPEGTVYGPDLSDAYRFKERSKAARVVAWLNRTSIDGLPYRVVRLRRKVAPEVAALRAVAAAAQAFEDKIGLGVTAAGRALRVALKALPDGSKADGG